MRRRRLWKKRLAVLLTAVLSLLVPADAFLPAETVWAQTGSATVTASSLNVRAGAGTSYDSQTKLSKGTSVTVLSETTGTDGKLWYQIRYTDTSGASQTGYVLATYISFPVSYTYDGDFESYLSAQGFPDSYREPLRQLHAQYPNWVFTAYQTGLDWETVIENESVLGKNLVSTYSVSSCKSTEDGAYNWDTGVWTGFDGSSWVAASEAVIRYYMDPRNFLDEVYVFQFMDQTYDSSVHTQSGLVSMVENTFLAGDVITNGSASGALGTDTSSSSTVSSGSSSSSGGPGVSGSSAVVTSGEKSNVIVAPDSGSSGSSGTVSSPNAGSSDSGTLSSPSAGSSTSDSTSSGSSDSTEVRYQGPSASVSVHGAPLVGASAVITAGGPSSGSSSPSASSSVTVGSGSYVEAIMSAASASGVSPYVLAAMIIQEQGSDGSGSSIQGTVSGYEGYYNYFNVGAYASDGMTAVQRGLWYASQSGAYERPWTTPQLSIYGGALFYGTNYVDAGQDTLYLKKFNVQGENIYQHQYMTNVNGAASEGSLYAEGFSDEQKSGALTFNIPVYSNMPEEASAEPILDGSPNNKLSSLSVDGCSLTPTFDKDTSSYDLIVGSGVSSLTVSASAISSAASVSGTGTVMLGSGSTAISIVVTAENGSQRTYTIHVSRGSSGSTSSSSGSSPAGTSGASSADTSVTVVGPSASGSSSSSGSGQGISSGSGSVSYVGPGG